MFVWKSQYQDLMDSKERQKKYYEDLLAINAKREDDTHTRLLEADEKNSQLQCDIKTLEYQVSYLYDLIGKLRELLGVEVIEASEPEPDSSDHTPCE